MALDANGYAPSLMDTSPGECWLCTKKRETARHEVFHGPYRTKSKRLGAWLDLCPECHARIHEGGRLERQVKAVAQEVLQSSLGWTTERFINEFGKNYREE